MEWWKWRAPAHSITSHNRSPDVVFEPFDQSYQGREHGGIYCYARLSHACLNLSLGLDFETRLFYKPNAAELLDAELRKPGYVPAMVSLGANTDPYQPIERDPDLLQDLTRDHLVSVSISITTLNPELKRTAGTARGEGEFARVIRKSFRDRLSVARSQRWERPALETRHFKLPKAVGDQLSLD